MATYSNLYNTSLQTDGRYKIEFKGKGSGRIVIHFYAPTDNYTFTINCQGSGNRSYTYLYISNLDKLFNNLSSSFSPNASEYHSKFENNRTSTKTVTFTNIPMGQHAIDIVYPVNYSTNTTWYFWIWNDPEPGINLNNYSFIYTGNIIDLDYTENEDVISLIIKQNGTVKEFKYPGEYIAEVTTATGIYQYLVTILGRDFTGLEKLDGDLIPGDKITYNNDTNINLNGYKVRVDLLGSNLSSVLDMHGKAKFILDSSKLPLPNVIFTKQYGCSLCYQEKDPYYRIAVAGNPASKAGYGLGGFGGGINGCDGINSTKGLGGTQTAVGTSGVAGAVEYINISGDGFGVNQTFSSKNQSYDLVVLAYGGLGWYNGGSTMGLKYKPNSGYWEYGSPGGGSGFIIGISTTTYPTGYLGNNTQLISTISSAISDGELIQGTANKATNSYKSDGQMVLTILEVPSTGPSQSIIRYYTNSEFKDTTASYYNGTDFVECDAYYYNGTEFIKI